MLNTKPPFSSKTHNTSNPFTPISRIFLLLTLYKTFLLFHITLLCAEFFPSRRYVQGYSPCVIWPWRNWRPTTAREISTIKLLANSTSRGRYLCCVFGVNIFGYCSRVSRKMSLYFLCLAIELWQRLTLMTLKMKKRDDTEVKSTARSTTAFIIQ